MLSSCVLDYFKFPVSFKQNGLCYYRSKVLVVQTVIKMSYS